MTAYVKPMKILRYGWLESMFRLVVQTQVLATPG